MSDPTAGPGAGLDPAPGDPDEDRAALDEIFKKGERARQDALPLCDNPYAPGTREREEWSAGWSATVEPDNNDEEPNSGYVKN